MFTNSKGLVLKFESESLRNRSLAILRGLAKKSTLNIRFAASLTPLQLHNKSYVYDHFNGVAGVKVVDWGDRLLIENSDGSHK